MNNNKCKGFIRFAASSIATVGILGGGALGFAAGANASTATPDQMKRQHMAEERADPHSPPVQTGQRTAPTARPVQPRPPTDPGVPNHERPRRG
jgi:hypothetical protein